MHKVLNIPDEAVCLIKEALNDVIFSIFEDASCPYITDERHSSLKDELLLMFHLVHRMQ